MGWGTTDNIFILRQIIEKAYEYNINLHVLFVDFKQAFDSIQGIKICEILQQTEIPAKFVRLIEITVEQSEGRTIHEHNLSEKFSVFKQVRQGDNFSTVFLNVTLDDIIKKCMSRETVADKMTQINMCADDVVMMAKSTKPIKELLKPLKEIAHEVGLSINQEKTKCLEINAN